MGSIHHPTEIHDELELMKGTQAVPRPISFASETDTASSTNSSTATFSHSRYPFPYASRNSDDNEWNLPSSVQSPQFVSIGALTNVTRPRRDLSYHDKTRELTRPQPTMIIDLEDASEEEECPVARRQPTEIIDIEYASGEENIPFIRCQPPVIIDLEDEEGPSLNNPPAGNEIEERLARARSQTARQLRTIPILMRNPPIVTPLKTLDAYTINDIKVNPKANLELCDGDFLRVVDIVQDTRTQEVTLRGWIFRRTKEMNGMLERKLNEVCWIVHVDEDDTRDGGIQGMESVPVSEVVKRRHIRMTNRPYPQLSWREHPEEDEEVIANERVLVCRFKYVIYYPDAKARERNNWSEKAMQRIQAEECDSSCSMADEALRRSWRGDTIKGGACISLVPGEVEFLRNERERLKRRRGSLAYRSERRRRSVVSLSTGLDLAQAQDTAIDNDLQEIDPPLLSTQVSDKLKHQPSPECAGAVEMANNDQRPTVESSHRSSSSDRTDQLGIQKSSKPEFVRAAKRQKLSMQFSHASKMDIIDLTNNEPNQIYYFLDEARSEHCKRTGADVSSSRYASPEVVEVRAQIDTSCKFGTMRREYQGQITSTYIPRNSKPLEAGGSFKSVLPELSEPASSCSINPTTKKPNKKCILPISRALDTKPKPMPVSPDISRLSSIAGQRYTFGDCFCGAGGTSRGAVDAGLRVEWGFDFDLSACKSYALNYIAADVYNVDAHYFSSLTDKEHKVDICHLSPPCQYFSDAHTVSGKDDDMNVASLFAVFELLYQAKPRVVTLEQTSGLLRRHILYFNAVILMFTARGFSIRWRVIDCANYGVPQKRSRLIMIASCPGEVLPTFPKPTHTEDLSTQPHLKPWVTINAVISSIPSTCSDNDIDIAARSINGIPYDGNSLARCITTSGGGNIHPSGQRNLTVREFACLQGFPPEQKFYTSGAKRQIGNAVPPIVAKLIFEEIKRALMKADGLL